MPRPAAKRPKPPPAPDPETESEEEEHDDEDQNAIIGPTGDLNISLEEAWEQLKALVSSLRKINKAKTEKDRRRFKKDIRFNCSWGQVIEAIGNQAGIHGLTQDEINLLWEIVTSANVGVKMLAKHRRALIFCMVPHKEKLHDVFVENIIDWVVRIDKTVPIHMSTAKTSLEYLNGVLEYDLMSSKVFRNHLNFGLLFTLHTFESLITWICRLLTQISRPFLIQRCHVFNLLDMLSKDISPSSRQSLHLLLRYYKDVRPYLIPNDLARMTFKSRGKKADMDASFRKRLYEAKARLAGDYTSQLFFREESPEKGLTGETTVDSRYLVFPEFQLGMIDTNLYNRDNVMKLSKMDIMRSSILTPNSVFMIAKDPEALEAFNTWLALIFHHRFNEPDKKSLPQYKFILEKCFEVTLLMDKSLAAVDCWLPNYILSWDGQFCRQEIFKLLSFMSPVDFEDGYEFVLEALEDFMLDGGDEYRFQVWGVLSKMAVRWVHEVLDDGALEPALQQLIEFMNSMVCKYAAMDEGINPHLLHVFCRGYSAVIQTLLDTKLTLSFEPYPPTVLWWMVVLSDSVAALDSFCKLQKICVSFQHSCTTLSPSMDKLATEVGNFFTNEPGSSGLTNLFKQELRLYEKQEMQETGEGTQIFSEIRNKILESLSSMNAYNIGCLENYREESKKTVVFNKLKLKADAPNVVDLLEASGCVFK